MMGGCGNTWGRGDEYGGGSRRLTDEITSLNSRCDTCGASRTPSPPPPSPARDPPLKRDPFLEREPSLKRRPSLKTGPSLNRGSPLERSAPLKRGPRLESGPSHCTSIKLKRTCAKSKKQHTSTAIYQ